MNIDFSKIKEIYGKDVLYSCEANFDDLIENITTLEKSGIQNVNEVVERYPFIVLNESSEFATKLNKFLMSLGEDYQKKLENNMTLWEKLL